MPKFFKFWTFVSLAVIIFWLSVIKAPNLKFTEHWFWDNIDKFNHALAYGTLCFSGMFSFIRFSEKKQISKKKIRAIMLLCFLYGLIIEFVQHFLPHRSFDPFDMLANAVGIILGAAVSARLIS